MLRLVLIIIGCSILYYFTNNIILSAGLFLSLFILLIWNSQFVIIRRREAVNQAIGNIEDAFQKRYDILTKIFDSIKGYIQYKEKELDEISTLFRNLTNHSFNYKERFKLQNQLKNILINDVSSLRDHNAGKQFEILNRSINEVEENLSASRRFYNHAVNEFNTSIKTFPAFIIAKNKGYKEISYFEVEDEAVKRDVKIKFDD